MSTSSPAVGRPARRTTTTLHSPIVNGSEPRPEKLFNQDDEIKLLKTLADRSTSSSPATGLVESMGDRFTPSQLSHKIRRLRLKYHKMARSKSTIKTLHDSEVFEISRRIWGKRKPQQPQPPEEGLASPVADGEEMMDEVAGVEVVDDLERFPVLVDECEQSLRIIGVAWREALQGVYEERLRVMNEKLVLLRCEEATFMVKKAKLVRKLTGMILLGKAGIYVSYRATCCLDGDLINIMKGATKKSKQQSISKN